MILRFAVASLVLLMVAACGDPCTPGTDVSHCEGNLAATCPFPGVDQLVGTNRWAREDCSASGKVCVAAGGSAFCALNGTAVPACDGGSSTACTSSTALVYCQSGFATLSTPCLSCGPSDAGSARCEGGLASKCLDTAQCAPPLFCSRSYCIADAG